MSTHADDGVARSVQADVALQHSLVRLAVLAARVPRRGRRGARVRLSPYHAHCTHYTNR